MDDQILGKKLVEIETRRGRWKPYWRLVGQTNSDDRRFLLAFGEAAEGDREFLLGEVKRLRKLLADLAAGPTNTCTVAKPLKLGPGW